MKTHNCYVLFLTMYYVVRQTLCKFQIFHLSQTTFAKFITNIKELQLNEIDHFNIDENVSTIARAVKYTAQLRLTDCGWIESRFGQYIHFNMHQKNGLCEKITFVCDRFPFSLFLSKSLRAKELIVLHNVLHLYIYDMQCCQFKQAVLKVGALVRPLPSLNEAQIVSMNVKVNERLIHF